MNSALVQSYMMNTKTVRSKIIAAAKGADPGFLVRCGYCAHKFTRFGLRKDVFPVQCPACGNINTKQEG